MRVLKGHTDVSEPRSGKGGVTRSSLLLATMAVMVLAACTGAGNGRGGAPTPHRSASVPARPHTTVGVIRWDLWSEHNQSNSLVVGLSQPRWRYRLPFYATNLGEETVTIREDRQSVMNKEIGYASSAGIDYWAFDFYDPNGIGSRPMHMNYGVELFKASSLNHRMRYALITTDGTTPKAWPSYSDALVSNFTYPRY